MTELMAGMQERRRPKGHTSHAYRWLKTGAFGAAILGLLGVVGILLAGVLQPELSGPAYLALINVNVIILTFLVLYIGRKVLVMFLDRRGRLAGGRLHIRLLAIFSFLAIVPAACVTLMAIYLLNQGVESWFSGKVTGALEGSLEAAQAYLDEHEHGLLLEVQGMGRDTVWRDPLMLDPLSLRRWLAEQAAAKNLDMLAVLDSNGRQMATGGGFGSVNLPPEAVAAMDSPLPSPFVMKANRAGQIVALVPVRGDLWLVGQQTVNPAVLARVDQTNAAYQEYFKLREERDKIRLLATLFLVMLGLGGLAGASWTGLRLANRIVQPVTALVQATNQVSAGEYDVRLTPRFDDELGVLTQAFNRMAQQLLHNRDLLERKNHELDERRRQMEAVLTGVTAGVLRVDERGLVVLANAGAERMLGLKKGLVLDKAVPPLGELAANTVKFPRGLEEHELKVDVPGGGSRMLQVRLVPQYVEGGKVGGVVLTFDDITPLIGAQRLAAWRDVARRLAHEIKNPLTPIKLSAERLQRKYFTHIPEADQKLYKELTTTIINQAEDMRRMTNEFSEFARLPGAIKKDESLIEIVEEAVAVQRPKASSIEFVVTNQLKPGEDNVVADRGQFVNRVLVNLLENATHAIEERTGTSLPKGRIEVVVKKTQSDKVSVTVLDNGKGLPPEVEEEHLFDPYVTTRKGGTGLGLAMVRRVMDEHDGQARLRRRPEGGAAVELSLPQIVPAAFLVAGAAATGRKKEKKLKVKGGTHGKSGKSRYSGRR
ncbi:MAG TPA: ATP-binding protein [Alphaproteobacteria bacterium]|nr:ATP-binding protein [Alphaproteobacteria bacterium]